jgi:putative transposase
VVFYIQFPLSLRNDEDLLHERTIEISHEAVRFWWNRLSQMFAAEIRRNWVTQMRVFELAVASGRGIREDQLLLTCPK